MKKLDGIVVVSTILTGVLSLLLDVYIFAKPYFSQVNEHLTTHNGATVSFLGFIVLKTIIMVLVTQSLWFKYVRNSRWIRFVASLLIFFLLFFQQIITLITGLN